jgi:N-acyl-D-amino-acid deacylase
MYDVIVVGDTATYDEPQQLPDGIDCVIVNGQVAFENGTGTDAGAGRMLRFRRSAWGEPE